MIKREKKTIKLQLYILIILLAKSRDARTKLSQEILSKEIRVPEEHEKTR